MIETRQATSLEGQRIVVSIDSWPQHSKYPVVSHDDSVLSYMTDILF